MIDIEVFDITSETTIISSYDCKNEDAMIPGNGDIIVDEKTWKSYIVNYREFSYDKNDKLKCVHIYCREK